MRKRRGRALRAPLATAVSVALCALSLGVVGGSSAHAVAGCQAGAASDFNGDGVTDVAIADPEATVSGRAEAGLVRIVYGGGKGTTAISQDSEGVPGASEAGDRYGHALAVYDANRDGCSDLVVGIPYEDLEDKADAGLVHVLHGAPGGLNTGPKVTEYLQGKGSGSLASATYEPGDWLGYSLAAGHTASGEPYLVIGVPGEDLGAVADAGGVHYLRGSVNRAINQETPGVSGVAERDDRFGYAIAASPHHLAIGNPGEAIGAETFSGGMQLHRHTLNGDGIPAPVAGVHQDAPGINGLAETGDQFAASLAAVPYRPSGASSANHTLVAVGVPGEDLTTGEDAGRVVVLEVTASGTVRQQADIHQSYAAVTGVGEDGDYFGQHLTAVNTAPSAVSTADTVLLAVGIPGEDLGEAADAGAVQVFPMAGEPGSADVWLEKGMHGVPGGYGPGEYVGTSLAATAGRLYVGVPYGPADAHGVYGVPWRNLTSGGTAAVSSWRPGEGGIPADHTAFGAVVR
ncbi:VCBS repeat-containing protein [Streptomyces sp. TRM 70351]|uniref:FG-GAP repeat domain-containing protein n=1 Tax=Streptomyces sp. TRM 70351 TaxID=3116552 RepID=UPI002E7AE5EA|nr:VCBS repeat-containing protein [Streptomyces sp. TRM 70351]MEE1930854.1 VCBS repeat-containing protein [Streptomyces sp. TRM 70351]